jgi:hypothetical protein
MGEVEGNSFIANASTTYWSARCHNREDHNMNKQLFLESLAMLLPTEVTCVKVEGKLRRILNK